jgi:hypothetical protein
MPLKRSPGFVLAFVTSLLFLAREASADDELEACVSGYEQSQRLRLGGQLRAAHEKLLLCARPACPPVVRSSCTEWKNEVEKQLATIVIKGRGGEASGNVYLDGEKVTPGQPIWIEAGSHEVRYEPTSGKSSSERVTLTEGEKNHVVVVDSGSAPATPEGPPPAKTEPWSFSTKVWVLAGVGAAGLIGFTAFGLMGKGDEKCAPNCTDDQVSTLRTHYVLADVGLLIGLIAGGAATYFAFTEARPAPAAQ